MVAQSQASRAKENFMCGGLWLLRTDDGHCQAVRLLCKTWGCPYCGKKRRKSLIALGLRGEPNTFLTLTTSPQTATDPTKRAKVLVKAFRTIVREIRKQRPNRDFEYLAVDGSPAKRQPTLARPLPVDLDRPGVALKPHERASGRPDRRYPTNNQHHHASRYVAKYVGKAPQRFGKLKRYWHSKRWDLHHRPRKGSYAFTDATEYTMVADAAAVIVEMRRLGYTIKESGWD